MSSALRWLSFEPCILSAPWGSDCGVWGSECGSNCCCWRSRWNCLFLQSYQCWRGSAQSSWLRWLTVSELFPGRPRFWRGAHHRAAQVQALRPLCSHPHGLGSIRMHWLHIADGSVPSSERCLGCNASTHTGNCVDRRATVPSDAITVPRMSALFFVFWRFVWCFCSGAIVSLACHRRRVQNGVSMHRQPREGLQGFPASFFLLLSGPRREF